MYVLTENEVSISRLYASAASRIAWEGNAAALALFVCFVPAEDARSEGSRQDMPAYISNKEATFAPWSLRRLLGLKNSSNGVETTNQMVVSARQRDSDLMFWRGRGSGALATCKAAHGNGSSHQWLTEWRISPTIPGLAHAG